MRVVMVRCLVRLYSAIMRETMTAIAFKWWNFRFSVIVMVCICMGCGGGLAASIPAGFELADEDIYDAPSKAQVVQRWFVTETPTRQELQAALESMHKVAMDRKGFRYHPKTTNVYIYVFLRNMTCGSECPVLPKQWTLRTSTNG